MQNENKEMKIKNLKENSEYIKKIKQLKNKFEGIKIIGIVGSFARGENFNDIDLLYEVDKHFLNEVDPFYFFTYLTNIKEELKRYLGVEVDLIDITTLNSIGKKYMLKDFINV